MRCGDVAPRHVRDPLLGYANRAPLEPLVVTGAALQARLEAPQPLPAPEPSRQRPRVVQVVGVREIQPGDAVEIVRLVAEKGSEAAVDAPEGAVLPVDDREGVG